jgi:WD40 repeat protein
VARLWDIQASYERGTFSGAQGFMYGLSFSPDGQYVLIGTKDHTLFETATANQLQIFTHPSTLQAVEFSPDGNCILTGNVDAIDGITNRTTCAN